MKNWMRALVAGIALVLLTGCATTTFRSNVTAFHEGPALMQGSSYVFERSKEQDSSLEYRSYENLVRGELARLGFVEASPAVSPQLLVSFSYSIDGRDVRISEPVVIHPYGYGYGPAWRGYYGPYYSPFYDPFWYGPPIIERRETNYRLFTRRLHIVLMRAADRKAVWETTVVSEGTNGSLAAVMPYLVRSAFVDFPGQSGVTRQVDIEVEARN